MIQKRPYLMNQMGVFFIKIMPDHIPGLDFLVIRPITKQVGGRIYEPGRVQHSNVLGKHGDQCHEKLFIPKVHRHKNWNKKSEEQVQNDVISAK